MAIFCLCFTINGIGQNAILLDSVEITTKKLELAQIGKKLELIDTTAKEQFKLNSIADVLSTNTPIFIKSYGPGALATTAFRGGNASQTAILWNGFNIQNAMLGQSDLSVIPSFLFENVMVEYGGSSSLWGSGAIAGSVHLKNASVFNTGLKTMVNIGTGSFGLKNMSTAISFSKKKFSIVSKIYSSSSTNNFTYKDTTTKENSVQQQKNASYNFIGLMQEFKLIINSKQTLALSTWLNKNQRQLPSYNTATLAKTYQNDATAKIIANWTFMSSCFKSVLKAGVFNDKLNYTDSLTSVFSKSNSQTIIAESENYVPINKYQQLNFGFNVSSSVAKTNNYSSLKILNKYSALLGHKFSCFNDRWLIYTAIRADYFNTGNLPITGNISTEYQINSKLSLLTNAAKVYRQPTLNELYWLPGGNINLKPEQGYTFDGAITYKKQIAQIGFFASGSAFSRQIHDWILWIPGANGNPSAINLQTVWSRGTESNVKIKYTKNKFYTELSFLTSYILSTVSASYQENNSSKNKQLIYTPRYTGNAIITIAYEKTALSFYNNYIGYRFTTSDNFQWLNPYYISSVRLNYFTKFKIVDFTLFTACNNLFNNNYTIIAGRPMPLRNFEVGLTLQSTNKNQNKH